MRFLGLVALACVAGCSGSNREASDLTVRRYSYMNKALTGRMLLDAYLSGTAVNGESLPEPEASKSLAKLDAEADKIKATLNATHHNKDPKISDYSLGRSTRCIDMDVPNDVKRDAQAKLVRAECTLLATRFQAGEITKAEFGSKAEAVYKKAWDDLMAMHDESEKTLLAVNP